MTKHIQNIRTVSETVIVQYDDCTSDLFGFAEMQQLLRASTLENERRRLEFQTELCKAALTARELSAGREAPTSAYAIVTVEIPGCSRGRAVLEDVGEVDVYNDLSVFPIEVGTKIVVIRVYDTWMVVGVECV